VTQTLFVCRGFWASSTKDIILQSRQVRSGCSALSIHWELGSCCLEEGIQGREFIQGFISSIVLSPPCISS
jgi:hypothetical protein